MSYERPLVIPGYPVGDRLVAQLERESVTTDGLLRFVRRRWALIVKWLLVSLVCGAGLAWLTVPTYTATATMLLQRPERPATGGPWAGAADPTFVDDQVQLILSEEILGPVVDRERLSDNEKFGHRIAFRQGPALRLAERLDNSARAIVRSLAAPALGPQQAPTGPELRKATVGRLVSALSVRREGLTDAVTITFTSQEPQLSAAVANAIARSYVDDLKKQSEESQKEAQDRLQQRLVELHEKAFSARQPPADPSLSTTAAQEEAQAQFRDAQNRAETYRALYDRLLQRSYMDPVDQGAPGGARIITAAEPPNRQDRKRMTLAFAVLALGTILGFGHAVLKHSIDRTIWSPDDVKRLVGVDRVSVFASSRKKGGRMRGNRPQRSYQHRLPGIEAAAGRLAIELRAQDQAGSIVALVGANARTGASTVAVHLARAFAQAGPPTLLIDANWRGNRHAKPSAGALSAQEFAEARAFHGAGEETLGILELRTASAITDLNAALAIRAQIETMLLPFRWIVVDFHSRNQSLDFIPSLSVLNKVFLVAEARRTSADQLLEMLNAIPGDKFAGVILNKARG